MCPSPPSSPDGSSLPPRHRPSLDDLARDTTEQDLWAFDDDPGLEEIQADLPRPGGSEIPAPRNPKPRELKPVPSESATEHTPRQPQIPDPSELIRINVNKPKVHRPASPAPETFGTEGGIDDSYQWEDLPSDDEIEASSPAEAAPEIHEPPQVFIPSAEPQDEEEPPNPEPASPPAPATPVETSIAKPRQDSEDDEFSPAILENATPVSLRPHLGLSKIERLSLFTLLLILIAAAVAILTFSLSRLPTKSALEDPIDFPIQGKYLTIVAAETYWRAPVVDGPTPDTVRRGTALIPAVELKFAASSGVVRVLFRNDAGQPIGDNLTRTVRANEVLEVAATAGFDDPGMHAAYRTDHGGKWKVEIYELPPAADSGSAHTKLLEMEISPSRR